MDLVFVAIGLLVSVAVAAVLLTRQRARTRPDDYEAGTPTPALIPKRQERLLAKLEPLPEIPTLMDLVREEIAETGAATIPGHEGLPDGVILKVFRRDHLVRERCTHEGFAYVVAEGVEPADALEADVSLYCELCGPLPNDAGTEPDEQALGLED